jgi:hypothetical protein
VGRSRVQCLVHLLEKELGERLERRKHCLASGVTAARRRAEASVLHAWRARESEERERATQHARGPSRRSDECVKHLGRGSRGRNGVRHGPSAEGTEGDEGGEHTCASATARRKARCFGLARARATHPRRCPRQGILGRGVASPAPPADCTSLACEDSNMCPSTLFPSGARR